MRRTVKVLAAIGTTAIVQPPGGKPIRAQTSMPGLESGMLVEADFNQSGVFVISTAGASDEKSGGGGQTYIPANNLSFSQGPQITLTQSVRDTSALSGLHGKIIHAYGGGLIDTSTAYWTEAEKQNVGTLIQAIYNMLGLIDPTTGKIK